MIELITGLPGNGKTLYTIKYVKEWAEKDNRPVFYNGIVILDEVALPWTQIDATKWFECPPGAIVVIDECQTIFRPRSLGKEPPDYVAKLETHRHLGIDIVLITQHPLLADASIRRLTGRHKHVIRKFGSEVSNIHEWNSARDNCDKPAGRKDSIKHVWKYDKSVYQWYRSAEVHTVKKNIPMKWYLIMATPFFVIACGFGIYKAMFNTTVVQPPPPKAETAAAKNGFDPVPYKGETAAPKERWQDPMADAKRYVYDQTPRVVGLPHTAPRYDGVTAPVSAPVPAACVVMRNVCKCYSQQGTSLDTPDDMCREIVERGYYVDFRQEQQNQGQPYLVRGDALRVPVDPHQPEQIRSGSAMLSADLTTAGRTPDGVRSRQQDSKHLAY